MTDTELSAELPAGDPAAVLAPLTGTADALAKPAIDATYAAVLAAYKKVTDRMNEAAREQRALRKLVDAMPLGTYDGWLKTIGESSELVDMDKVEALYAELGREVPKKLGAPPLRVQFVGRDSGA